MAEEREVKAKLTLDDGATATMERIKGGFTQLEGTRQAAQRGLGFMSNSLSTLAGVHFPSAIRGATNFASSFITAASGGQEFDASIASMISTVQQIPFEEAMDRAGRYADELDRLSVRHGVATDQIEGAFGRLLAIQDATAEGVFDARMQIDQLTAISGKMKLPLEAVSQEFGFMSEGVLKTRGRLFQLLQSTGVFGADTKNIAKGWAELTDEKRLAILTDGLTRATTQLGKAPPTFNQLRQSLANIVDISKEKLGEPFIEALMPQLQRLVTFLGDNEMAIEQFAKTMAVDVGRWVEQAADEIENGFKFLRDHGAELREDIVAAFETGREVIQFALAHKEELALAFGANAVARSGLGQAAGSVVGAVARAGAGGTAVGAAQLAGFAGGAAALGAFGLALGGATAAVLAFKDASASRTFDSERELDLEAKRAALAKIGTEGPQFGDRTTGAQQIEFIERMEREATMLAAKEGESVENIAALARSLREQQSVANELSAVAAETAERLRSSSLSMAEQDIAAAMAAGTSLGTMFQQAAASNNVGLQRYMASLFVGSKQLQDAFLVSGVMTADAFTALAELVGDKAGDFADKLRQKAGITAGKAAPDKPLVQFNGGQTFKVQQDFRDEDPDRIALLFQRGILSSAERRLQASTSSPFGF